MYCQQCGKEYVTDEAAICVQCGTQKGAGMSYCHQCGTQLHEGSSLCMNCGVNNQQIYQGGVQKSKLVAGLLGIFLGTLGIHNFYLGNNQKGLIQVLVSIIGGILTCGIATVAIQIWALVEAIQILTGSINTDANGVPLKE